MATMTYTLGDTWVETVEFRVAGTLTDPTTFTATVYKPDGTTASPTITSGGTGIKIVSTDLTQEGDWYLHAVGTGPAKGAKDTYVTVRGVQAPGLKLIAESLVTVADMRFFLDRTGLAPDLDELRWLEDLINAYSLAAARYCNRQFTPERDASGATPARRPLKTDPLLTAQAKKFMYDGHGYLDFSPYELRNITSIVVGTDLPTASQVTLFVGDANRESEYRLEPSAKTTEQTWLWAVLPPLDPRTGGWTGWTGWPGTSSSVVSFPLAGRQVTVTGDWGAADGTIPPDVAHACKIAVGDAFRNPEAYATRAAAGLDIAENFSPLPSSLPMAARALLAPYRRP